VIDLDLVSIPWIDKPAKVDQDHGEGQEWGQGLLGAVVAKPEALEPQ
jgi:hypothetical protein